MTQVQLPHARHVRRRKFRGLDRGSPGISRNPKMDAWLDAQAANLLATGAGQTFVADIVNDDITIALHARGNGDGPFEMTSAGVLPAGIDVNTLYWVSDEAATTNELELYRSRKAAIAGIANAGADAVDITDIGSGIHTMTPSESNEGMRELLRQGNSPERIVAETDIDNLI